MTTSDVKVELSDVELNHATKMQLNMTLELINHHAKALSSKNIRRALYAALVHGVDDTKIRFVHKKEPEIAALIAKAIDLKILLKAQQFKQEEEKNEKRQVDTVGDTPNQEGLGGES